MMLDDLLDTLRRDILHDTSSRVSGDSDQLWSDTTLIRNIDAAQRRFARRSLCIRDGTSPVTRFVTVPLQADYTLDPSVISIYSMRSLGNGAWVNGVYLAGSYNAEGVFQPSGANPLYPDECDLKRISHDQRRGYSYVLNDEPFDVNNLLTLGPAKPLTFETDETVGESNGSSGVVSTRLYPIPSAVYAGCTIQMRVARMPLERLTPNTMTASPEIPEDYHLDMLDYAAYLALRVEDHEAGDPGRAQEFQQSFDRHVEEARTELQRKTFAPTRFRFGNGYTGN